MKRMYFESSVTGFRYQNLLGKDICRDELIAVAVILEHNWQRWQYGKYSDDECLLDLLRENGIYNVSCRLMELGEDLQA